MSEVAAYVLKDRARAGGALAGRHLAHRLQPCGHHDQRTSL
jgi:hypothetical protein